MERKTRKPKVLIVTPERLQAMSEKFQRRYPSIKVHSLGVEGRQATEVLLKYDTRELAHELKDVEVLFFALAKNAIPSILSLLPSLRWIQTGAAGPDHTVKLFRENKIPRSVVLTRNGVTFKRPMSQYVMGHILSCNMQFRQHAINQQTATWKESKLVANEQSARTHSDGGIKSLPKSTVTVLGLGPIGQEIARACKFFGMTVVGVTKTKVEEENKKKFVDICRESTDLPEALRSCDYLVNALPATRETRGLLSGDVLSQCRNKPVFINVGRGDIIDDDSLINALRRGWLSQAILDIFEVEPLPVESPLWKEPNIVITPHIAHGLDNEDMVDNVLEMFIANFERYISGEQLQDVVDIDKEY